MTLPSYALAGRCHPGTTQIFDTSVRNHLPLGSQWQHFSICAILIHLSNLRHQMVLHFTVMGAVLVVSDMPPALVHPIIFHDNKVRLVHIHLY